MANYTDIAIENFYSDGKISFGCSEIREEKMGIFKKLSLNIDDISLENKYEKPRGEYVTVYTPEVIFMSDNEKKKLSEIISEEIKKMVKKNTKKYFGLDTRVLLVGLGNQSVTADSLGPLVIKRSEVNSHIRLSSPELFKTVSTSELSAICVGVSAETGIESFRIVKGVSDQISPDAVIAIDSLAARGVERLGCTLQINDSGISPGSAINGNKNKIDKNSIGVPVISIGVPFIVDSASLIMDSIEKSGYSVPEKIKKTAIERRFFVAPKDCDVIVDEWSKIISSAIRSCFWSI